MQLQYTLKLRRIDFRPPLLWLF